MPTYGCRHTFREDFILQPWTITCTVCLRGVAPFTTVRRCTSCRCAIHEACYDLMVGMMQSAGDLMRQGWSTLGVNEASLASCTTNVAAASDSSGDGQAVTSVPMTSPPSLLENGPVSGVDSTQGHADSARAPLTPLAPPSRAGVVTTAFSTTTTAVSWRSPLLAATSLKSEDTSADVGGAESAGGPAIASVSAAAAKPTATTAVPPTSVPKTPVNPLLALFSPTRPPTENEETAPAAPTWWRKIPQFAGGSSPTTAASAAIAAAHSKHLLRPTVFMLPMQCARCYATRSPAEREEAVQRAAASRGATAAHLSKEGAPSSSWMGLGTAGYECMQCEVGLHRACLYCLDATEYELVAPEAHTMQGQSPSPAGDTEAWWGAAGAAFLPLFGGATPTAAAAATDGDSDTASSSCNAATLAGILEQFVNGFRPQSAAGTTPPTRAPKDQVPASLSSSSAWNAGKGLITTYLDTSGRNSRADPNVRLILTSLFRLMDVLQERHPRIVSDLFNPLRMHMLSVQDEASYMACCDALPDADFILAADSTNGSLDGDSSGDGDANGKQACLKEATTTTSSLLGMQHTGMPAESTAAAATARKAKSETVNYLPDVQMLRDTLRFAIAAYGETYRQGYLSSLFGSALAFTVARDDLGAAPKAKNDTAVTDVLALPRSSLVLSRWSTKATEPSYCVLVDHISQRIVVAFRGTLSDVDILTDVCAFGDPFCGGLAHQGAAQTVNRIFDGYAAKRKTAKEASPEIATESPPTTCTSSIAEAAAEGEAETAQFAQEKREGEEKESLTAPLLVSEDAEGEEDQLLETLARLAAEHSTYPILVTGHSLGGGLAVLFGVRLSHDRLLPDEVRSRFRVIAYAPMPTLTLPAAAAYDEPTHASSSSLPSSRHERPGAHYAFPIWSIVNGCDVVPRLQVSSVDRLCAHISPGGSIAERKHSGKERGSTLAEATASATTLAATSSIANSDTSDIHRDDAATPHKDDGSRKTSALAEEFHHPGRVFMLTTPWSPTTNRLVEVPRGHAVMHQMFLMRPMLALHMMDNYIEGLRCVRSEAQLQREKAASQATAPEKLSPSSNNSSL